MKKRTRLIPEVTRVDLVKQGVNDHAVVVMAKGKEEDAAADYAAEKVLKTAIILHPDLPVEDAVTKYASSPEGQAMYAAAYAEAETGVMPTAKGERYMSKALVERLERLEAGIAAFDALLVAKFNATAKEKDPADRAVAFESQPAVQELYASKRTLLADKAAAEARLKVAKAAEDALKVKARKYYPAEKSVAKAEAKFLAENEEAGELYKQYRAEKNAIDLGGTTFSREDHEELAKRYEAERVAKLGGDAGRGYLDDSAPRATRTASFSGEPDSSRRKEVGSSGAPDDTEEGFALAARKAFPGAASQAHAESDYANTDAGRQHYARLKSAGAITKSAFEETK